MVEVSIERALFTIDEAKRPSDRLDYRYIESFLKLMVVLLKTSDINKHEFMSKLFEAIHEVLDEDHKTKKGEFNQKPYYRLLINILTVVNNSQFFNQKTHQLILFSLADLFNKLSPNKYPAFAFAWLELISHKQFMPHFLQAQQAQLNVYN
jgi:CCR4-NOT transcription complex subunit 1